MDIKTYLPELKRLVTDLSEDLLQRSLAQPEIDTGLRDAFAQIEKGGRTADAFEVWREDYLDQVAVAWVLSCVFVRFMEDNHLIDECWLAGDGERRKLAEDTHELYFRAHPHESDREYFEHVFHEVGKIPACRDLFAEGKTPLWAVGPSGDAAMRLLTFWREVVPETGGLRRGFSTEGFRFSVFGVQFSANPSPIENRKPKAENPDNDPTRFLGDLYQDLSERARKKYALLQTPVFVEEFILDRTLDPAIDEFGLIHKTNDQGQLTNDSFRMIDPTCGSGHFLLGGFARLFDLWIKREDNEVVAAQKALDGVWGCDINPFAVAIARFRLIVAALRACGITRLKDSPAWNIHLATGDSLLFGRRWDRAGTAKNEQKFFETEVEGNWAPEIYACEDREAINQVLGQQYHVVVGNPPYITPKDKALNQAYRDRYATCHRQYSLAVPFMERFFDLAVGGGTTTKETKDTKGEEKQSAGYVGQITANSFMKREFGKKLIEEYFSKVDLTHVIDTSGAYIPGHGTPTVILFGRNRRPVGKTVRAVLGIKGEPSTPADPSQGLVWQSIIKHIDVANAQDAFTSTADVPRATFTTHPWSIGGGGASDIVGIITSNCKSIEAYCESIGITCFTLEDDVYILPYEAARRHGIPAEQLRPMVLGDSLRDWSGTTCEPAVFPYTMEFEPIRDNSCPALFYLWPYRTNLSNNKMFGGKSKVETDLNWFEYGRLTAKKLRTPLSIAFAFVATHNHFVLDRGGKVFNRSAPIIKLPADATEDDHLALLGLLNSSTACFWMKQVFFPKGGDHVGQEGARVRRTWWDERYEFAGTQLQKFPVSKETPFLLSHELDQLAQQYMALLPEQWITAEVVPTRERLLESQQQTAHLRAQMIALQEELDWQCYELYGLLKDEGRRMKDEAHHSDSSFIIHPSSLHPHPLILGQRPFEIVMAQQMAAGELKTTWFQRHGSTPITDIPNDWPDEYRQLVERRIELIETNKVIGLIERPEYKRRWNTESWEAQQQRALRNWLLDRLEALFSFRFSVFGEEQPTAENRIPKSENHPPELITVAQVADRMAADSDFLQVAAIYRGRDDFDVAALVAELVESESVPFLPILRYKTSGLRKREVWERVWEMQREEDRRSSLVNGHLSLVNGHLSLVNGHLSLVNGHLSLENNPNDQEQITNDQGQMTNDQEQMTIPVPPKYASADFLKSDYWRLRGKLDVPKERWIGYPHCETESDPSLVVGWAGWNHLQQATALIAYYDARKREGWDAKRLTPLLAGLDQLLPWIHQWHPEVDPEFGETAGQSFETMLKADAHELGLTLEEIRAWEPPAKQKGGKPRKTRTTRKKKVDVEEDNHE